MNKNQLKQVQSLKYAKYRKLYGKFFIEGSRLVKGALDWSSTVEDIYCTRVFYNDNSASAIFNNIEKRNMPATRAINQFFGFSLFSSY